MEILKERAQKAQQELLDIILEFFARQPMKSFTVGVIIKELGIIPGKGKWFAHTHLNILVDMGKLEKCDHGQGFKYKENNCIKMAI